MAPLSEWEREAYLLPTQYLDFETPAVTAFANDAIGNAKSERERAVRLFYAVRDGIRYDPYTFRLLPEIYVASETLAAKTSFCIPKAILLAASARALGIPSRLRFADVRNHLTTERLREVMGTDVFIFHGYTELFLADEGVLPGGLGEGNWVKATPTFNKELCAKFGVQPLEFDGAADSIFHELDTKGERHMEYLVDRGFFADFPLDAMIAATRHGYPHLFGDAPAEVSTSLAAAAFIGELSRDAKPL